MSSFSGKNMENRFLTISNILSLSRIVLAIPANWLLFQPDQESRYLAVVIFIIAGFTDFLDGWTARKFNQVSEWGKILDPLADKIVIILTAICLVYLEIFPVWFVLAVVVRDVLIFAGGIYFKSKLNYIPVSLMSGKLTTNFIAAAGLAGMVMWNNVYNFFIVLSIIFMIYSFSEYLIRMINELKKVKD